MPVDLITLGAALLTGLLGGVHCVAMCGGIATGLSASAGKPGLGNAFALNGGRVLGYTVAGAIVGGFGGGLSSTVLVAAWLEASALHGALVMASFGLGTMATMVPVTWSGARLGGLLAHRAWRAGAASFVALAGLVTMAGPWLAGQPAIHAVLEAMGCRSI